MVSRSKFNICKCKTKILYRGGQQYLKSSFLVWVASKFLCTNGVNVLFSVSITSRNIYSRFISLIIICFTLNDSSNKKINMKKNHKKDFCRTKALDYGNLYHQGVALNKLGALSCLTYYLSDMCQK